MADSNADHALTALIQPVPSESINQAQLLLEYAAQKGLNIDEKVTTEIVKAKHLALENKWTSEAETSFWQAFDQLSGKVKPISVQSLKALKKVHEGGMPFLRKYLNQHKTSEADQIVKQYRKATLISVLLLLAVQIVYSYGAYVAGDLVKLPDQIDQVKLDQSKLPEKSGKTTGLKQSVEAERGVLEAKQLGLEMRVEASYDVLRKWLNVVRFWTIFSGAEEPSPPPGLTTMEKLRHDNLILVGMTQDAKFILQVIQFYLLPLLYGLVGSCAYILRTLSNEIRNVTYVPSSRVVYLTRFFLGGLSGLAIGWFISPETTSTIKTVSPFAIAFVAGYGVELLFAIMDKIIGTFSVPAVQRAQGENQ